VSLSREGGPTKGNEGRKGYEERERVGGTERGRER